MKGAGPARPPKVLFVCVHNAGRSQMAAVLTDSMSGGRVHVRSAGSTPASEINPVVVEAMRELGLDLAREFPKPLTDEVVQAADVVVTMGCGDAARSTPASDTWTGRSMTPPVSRSLQSAASGTISGRVSPSS